jgi:hypothetical protein
MNFIFSLLNKYTGIHLYSEEKDLSAILIGCLCRLVLKKSGEFGGNCDFISITFRMMEILRSSFMNARLTTSSLVANPVHPVFPITTATNNSFLSFFSISTPQVIQLRYSLFALSMIVDVAVNCVSQTRDQKVTDMFFNPLMIIRLLFACDLEGLLLEILKLCGRKVFDYKMEDLSVVGDVVCDSHVIRLCAVSMILSLRKQRSFYGLIEMSGEGGGVSGKFVILFYDFIFYFRDFIIIFFFLLLFSSVHLI